MEFWRELPFEVTPARLAELLTIARLSEWCASIDRVLEARGDEGVIYCLWGQFEVRREPLCEGVRFTLPHCPNALQWTVTSDEGQLVVHCTINRRAHDHDFIDSIHQFLDDWALGLERLSPS